jgi:hypothetical protein
MVAMVVDQQQRGAARMYIDASKAQTVMATVDAQQKAMRAEYQRQRDDAQNRLAEALGNLASADTYGRIQAELAAKLQLKLQRRTRKGARRWPDNGGIRVKDLTGPDPRYQDQTLLQPGCAE